MQERITRRQVTFLHPFTLAGVDGEQPAGTYEVETTEAPIDSLSLLAYRRVSTTMEVSSNLSAMVSRQRIDDRSPRSGSRRAARCGGTSRCACRAGRRMTTDRPIDLDRHRGMAAQKATDIRRLLAEVEANEQALRDRQQELEIQLLAVAATCWTEAAEKARYLLKLFAATPIAQDPRRQKLIANVIEDFERLTLADGAHDKSEQSPASPPARP